MMKRRAESYQIPYTATEREVWSRMKSRPFIKEKKIRHLTTVGHAHVAERTIKTIKDLYYNRRRQS